MEEESLGFGHGIIFLLCLVFIEEYLAKMMDKIYKADVTFYWYNIYKEYKKRKGIKADDRLYRDLSDKMHYWLDRHNVRFYRVKYLCTYTDGSKSNGVPAHLLAAYIFNLHANLNEDERIEGYYGLIYENFNYRKRTFWEGFKDAFF